MPFLEDIGKIVYTDITDTVFELTDFMGIPRILVLHNDLIGRLLLERHIYGVQRRDRIQAAFESFVLNPFISQELIPDRYVHMLQFLPQRSAEFCGFHRKFTYLDRDGYEIPLPTFYGELQRNVPEAKADECIQKEEVTASGLTTIKNWGSIEWFFINDTCAASGSTLEEAASCAIKKWPDSLDHVFVFSICASWQAIVRCMKMCRQNGIKFTPILGQAVFEVVEGAGLLGEHWTDLPITNQGNPDGSTPGTVTTRSYFETAYAYNQGKNLCAVANVGHTVRAPRKYLIETMRELEIVDMDLSYPEWQWILSEYKKLVSKKIPVPDSCRSFIEKFL